LDPNHAPKGKHVEWPLSALPLPFLILALGGATAVAMVLILFVVFPAHRDRPYPMPCSTGLQCLGNVLVADQRSDRGWPEASGAGFLLHLYFTCTEVRGDLKVLVCRGDEDTLCVCEPGSARHRVMFEGLTEQGLLEGDWPDHITSYAGRNQRDYPLSEPSDENRPIACDAGPFHEDGVNVLYEDGDVEFLTWKQLGIESAEDFHFGYGPKGCDGPGILKALCIRLK